jgi:hypothetical protein
MRRIWKRFEKKEIKWKKRSKISAEFFSLGCKEMFLP